MFDYYTYEELRQNCRACIASAKRWRTLNRTTANHYVAKARVLREKLFQRLYELGGVK